MENRINFNLRKGLKLKPTVEPEIFCPVCEKGKFILKKELFHIFKTKQTIKINNLLILDYSKPQFLF